MRLMIDDVLNLWRLRVQPLAAYQYPWWQSALLLTALGLIASGDTAELGDNIAGRIGFMQLLTWVETLGFVRFITVWLRLAKWQEAGSLFGLVVVASGFQFIEPLTSWLPADVAGAVDISLALFGTLVLINALKQVSGVSGLRVAVGVLLFGPIGLMLMALTMALSSSLGWVVIPPEMGGAAAGLVQPK